MLTVRSPNNKVNVYGGRRNTVGFQVNKAITANLRKNVKSKIYGLLVQLVKCLILASALAHIFKITTSLNLTKFQTIIDNLIGGLSSGIDIAVRMVEAMKNVPQPLINAGLGASASVMSNVLRLKKPSVSQAAMIGAGTVAVGMWSPLGKTNILKNLKSIQNTIHTSINIKNKASTTGAQIMSLALSGKSLRSFYHNLANAIASYIVKIGTMYGIKTIKKYIDFGRYVVKNNITKRMSLLNQNTKNAIVKQYLQNAMNRKNRNNGTRYLTSNTR
jgi:hypothetical protein